MLWSEKCFVRARERKGMQVYICVCMCVRACMHLCVCVCEIVFRCVSVFALCIQES